MKIRVARIFADHEKYGYFRFGLMSLAVVQGVHIEIESACLLTNALVKLNSWNLSTGNLRRLELRDLQISLLGEKEPRLRAARARVGSSGNLELSSVSVAGVEAATISKATLQISGPVAGPVELAGRHAGKRTLCT